MVCDHPCGVDGIREREHGATLHNANGGPQVTAQVHLFLMTGIAARRHEHPRTCVTGGVDIPVEAITACAPDPGVLAQVARLHASAPAAVMLGILTGLQRRATGGFVAPTMSHPTWSLGMPFLLPGTPGLVSRVLG